MSRYLTGESDEGLQRLREQVLSTTPDDFWAFGNVLGQLAEDGLVVVMGSQEAIDEANTARDGWLDVTRVL